MCAAVEKVEVEGEGKFVPYRSYLVCLLDTLGSTRVLVPHSQ